MKKKKSINELKSVIELSSAKVNALLNDLQHTFQKHKGVKAVVFSQWTKMLDLIEDMLKKNKKTFLQIFNQKISNKNKNNNNNNNKKKKEHKFFDKVAASEIFVRLDGSLTTKHRQQVITKFSEEKNVKIMLISLKAGGVGLNLTCASRVYLVDPWWNPAVEEQAIDRVHRIGQTKKVVVKKFVVKDTVEDKIQRLQEKKMKLAEGTLGLSVKQDKERKQNTIEEIKQLFC